MKSQAVTASAALLALCCLLMIPRGGESAGGIVSLQQAGDQLRDESPDDPEREQGLVADLLPEEGGIKTKREAEANQAGKWKKLYFVLLKHRCVMPTRYQSC